MLGLYFRGIFLHNVVLERGAYPWAKTSDQCRRKGNQQIFKGRTSIMVWDRSIMSWMKVRERKLEKGKRK